jgi:diacylglycerol kinase (ATP)
VNKNLREAIIYNGRALTSATFKKVRSMSNPHKGKTGLVRLYNAFHHTLAGLRAAFQHEDAFRMDVLLAAILIPAAFFTSAGAIGKALLVASVLLLLIVELLNSAIEAAVDHTSLEIHPFAKRAKDIGSAAVFISLLLIAVVWGLVLLG